MWQGPKGPKGHGLLGGGAMSVIYSEMITCSNAVNHWRSGGSKVAAGATTAISSSGGVSPEGLASVAHRAETGEVSVPIGEEAQATAA